MIKRYSRGDVVGDVSHGATDPSVPPRASAAPVDAAAPPTGLGAPSLTAPDVATLATGAPNPYEFDALMPAASYSFFLKLTDSAPGFGASAWTVTLSDATYLWMVADTPPPAVKVSGVGTTTLTLSGDGTDVLAAINNFDFYVSNPGGTGKDVVHVTASDGLGDTAQAAEVIDPSLLIPPAPTASAPASISAAEGVATRIGAVALTGPVSGAFVPAVTIAAQGGYLLAEPGAVAASTVGAVGPGGSTAVASLVLNGDAGYVERYLSDVSFVATDGAATDAVDVVVNGGTTTVAVDVSPADDGAGAYTWTGAHSTDYADPGNWAPGGTPGLGQTIAVSGGASTISGEGAADALTVTGATLDLAGALDLRGTRTAGDLTVGGSLLRIDGGFVQVSDATTLGSGASLELVGGAGQNLGEARLQTGSLTIGGGDAAVAFHGVVDVAAGADGQGVQTSGALSVQGGTLDLLTGSSAQWSDAALTGAGVLEAQDASVSLSGDSLSVGADGGHALVILNTKASLSGLLSLGQNATLLLGGGTVEASAVTVAAGGYIGGEGAVAADTTLNGIFEATGRVDYGTAPTPTALSGIITGTGTILIDAGAVLALDNAAGKSATTPQVVFEPGARPDFSTGLATSGVLDVVLSSGSVLADTISGFTQGDAIVVPLADVNVSASSYDSKTGALTLVSSGGKSVSLTVSGTFALSDLSFVPDVTGLFPGETEVVLMSPPPLPSPYTPGPVTIEAPAAIVVDTGAEQFLDSVAVGDLANPASDNLSVELKSLGGGIFTIPTVTGVTAAYNGTRSDLVIGGAAASVDRVLASLGYTPQSGATSDTIMVVAGDGKNTKADAARELTIGVTIGPARSQSYVGGAFGSFGAAADWSGGAPALGDMTTISTDAVLSGPGQTGSLSLHGARATFTGAVQIGSQAADSGNLTVDAGGIAAFTAGASLGASGTVLVGGAGGGELDLASSELQVSGFVGYGTDIEPSLVGALAIAPAGGTGTAEINAHLVVAGALTVGAQGSGVLALGTFGSLRDASAAIGDGPGSSTALAEGSWFTSGELDVAVSGQGTLETGGGFAEIGAGTLVAAVDAGSVATLSIDGGTRVQVGDLLTIGGQGTADVTVRQNASLSATYDATTFAPGVVDVAEQAGSVANLTLDDGSVTAGSDFNLGGTDGAAGGAARVQVGTGAGYGVIGSGATMHLWSGAKVALAGGQVEAKALTTDAGSTLEGYGVIEGYVTSNNSPILPATTFINNGTVVATGGTLAVWGALNGAGVAAVAAGATLELKLGGSDGVTIAAGGTLVLDNPQDFSGIVEGLATGGTGRLAGWAADSVTVSGSDLVVTDAGAAVASFGLAADETGLSFRAVSDGLAGALLEMACFSTGTRIATADGAARVETLQAGDTVRTASGSLAPVVWVGSRRVDCRRHPDPKSVLPVRVRAHAFADGVPSRDLLLSPDHAMFANGVLIPVKRLLNGDSVRQEDTDSVVYWHVELPHHDVLLAEGLPAESFLDTGQRLAFAGVAATQLHPRFSRAGLDSLVWDGLGCAPLAVVGPAVDAVRARLAERAPGIRAA